MVFACSCAKRMIQFTKIHKNRGLVLHSELFVDTSPEVYSQNNPYVSIGQSAEKTGWFI